MVDSQFIIVPRILFNDKSLSQTERCLLGLIISLTFKEKYCYASNNYLANYIKVSERTITDSLSKLRSLKYIVIKYENRKRKIYLNTEKIPMKSSSKVAKNCELKVEENCEHNINSNNKNKYKNYSNFKYNEPIPYWMKHPEVCKSEPASLEEQKELEELIEYFKRKE